MTPHLSPTPTLRHTDKLAEERFGSPAALATSNSTVLGLAATYADKYGLAESFPSDPEVTTAAIILATSRMTQAQLMFEAQRDIEEMMMDKGWDYGKTLFNIAKGGRHKEIWNEIDRLERRAVTYQKRLASLQAEAQSPAT